MKNSTLPQRHRDHPVLPCGEILGTPSRDQANAWRRSVVATASLAIVALLAACTTTVVTHAPELHPVTENSNPSSVSEQHIAESALASGNVQLATTIYEKMVVANPKSVAGLSGLGDTLYAVGDFTRADVQYQRALQIDPASYPSMLGAARVAIRQRRLDDAIALYRKIQALKPGDSLTCAGLGTALDLNGDHAQAQAEFRRGLKANPGDPGLSVDLGMSLILSGNPREAVNVLLDVTRYPAAPPEATQDLALAYGMLGNTEAASEILSTDLPKASVEDNLRFYAFQRARMKLPGGASNLPGDKPASVPNGAEQAKGGNASTGTSPSIASISSAAVQVMPIEATSSPREIK